MSIATQITAETIAMITTQPLRIAVADDEPDILRYYVKVLERMGHAVVVKATDGLELLKQVVQADADLVITDVRMPVMDGVTAAERIQRERPIPVIFVTGQQDPALHQAISDPSPGRYCLTKPIGVKDLGPAIENATQQTGGN